MPQGLPRKLRYAFILQAAMATFAIVIGVYAAGSILREYLSEQRILDEAEDYWRGRAVDPAFRLPHTATVDGYFIEQGGSTNGLPRELRPLRPGIHELPGASRKVLVERRREGTLYLSISFTLLDDVVRWTGLVSMLLALFAVYVVTWFTYRTARQLVVPINWLAGQVSKWDPSNPDTRAIAVERIPGARGSEVHQLGGALRDLSGRMYDFIRRERDFTRDASHELRTPLTVIRVATDMMLADGETPPRAQKSLQRMQRAGRDMEAVIDAFLILAREYDTESLSEEFVVQEVVSEAVERARELLQDKPVELIVKTYASPRLRAAPRVLTVMLDNLLDNACRFTETGHVEVCVDRRHVMVRDTGIGMSSDTLQKAYDPFYRADQFSAVGKGMGLSIVRRLGERFGWPVTLDSTPGHGTTATIGFDGHVLD